MHILASDPGLHGAIALLDTERMTLAVRDMPVQVRELANKKLRELVDEAELIALMSYYRDVGVADFYLEQVGGRPGQGAHAAFMFGSYVTAVRVAARAAGLHVHEVSAAVWKQAMKAPKDKKASRHRASELLPAFAHLWPRQMDADRAEAAMLALYGARQKGAWR